jgi:hypothetical protein
MKVAALRCCYCWTNSRPTNPSGGSWLRIFGEKIRTRIVSMDHRVEPGGDGLRAVAWIDRVGTSSEAPHFTSRRQWWLCAETSRLV